MNDNNLNPQNQFDNINNQVDNMQPQFDNMNNQVNNVQPQFNNMNNQINNVQPQFDNMNNQFDNVQPQFNNMNNQVNNVQPQFDNMNNQINNVQPQFDNMNNQFDNVSNYNNKSTISNVGVSSDLSKVNNGSLFKGNKKLFYIVGGVILLVIIFVVLYFTMFKKDEYKDYDDYVKEQEKIKEKINKNYSIKDYKILSGILVELKNDNNLIVDAELKIEFYDQSNNLVNVEDGYMFSISENGVGYTSVYVDKNINYSTYKITAKLNKSPYDKSYNDKVTVVSSGAQGDNYMIQIKNKSDVKLSNVEVGVFFLDANNTIIDYRYESFFELNAGETSSGKVYIPYDADYRDKIDYEKVDVKIIGAVSNLY